MPLGPGSRLDAYELVRPLGAGGMGEVWLASEVRLGRKVALKLLPADLTQDHARVNRFEQEARAASALSHPNVCTILAVGETPTGQQYIAMEYVQGETLQKRFATSHLTIVESLDIAIQIASALSAAHAAGIIHRDIKPENVMLRPDGLVKVLDFGLAKLVSATDALKAQSTRTAFQTDAGHVVGTIAYMSPEQARGHQVDARTDVWSLGCVLYEMVAGRSPFAAPSSSEVLAAILDREPAPIARFEPNVPSELQRIATKALRKDRELRYQGTQELLLDLQTLRDECRLQGSLPASPHAPGLTLQDTSPTRPGHRTRRALLAASLVATAGLVAAGTTWWWRRASPPKGPAASQTVSRNLSRLTFGAGLQTDAALSPDARFVAYASNRAGNFDIWVQPVAGGEPVQVTRAPDDDVQPDWSPDGSTVAFRSERSGGGIYLVSALGGPERRIAPAGERPMWSADGHRLLFLKGVPVPGAGPPMQYVVYDVREDRETALWPGTMIFNAAWHPDGRVSGWGVDPVPGEPEMRIGLFTRAVDGTSALYSPIPASCPEAIRRLIPDGVSRLAWSPDGAHLFVQVSSEDVGSIWRISVNPATLALESFERLTVGTERQSGFGLSREGTRLVYTAQSEVTRLWRLPADARTGQVKGPPVALTDEDGAAATFDISSDGTRLAYELWHSGSDRREFRVLEVRSGHTSTLTGNGERRRQPRWSPDGRRVAYHLVKDRVPPDISLAVWDTATAEHVVARLPEPFGSLIPFDWTSDGKRILVTHLGMSSAVELWAADASPPSAAAQVLIADANFRIWQQRYSPDGGWLSFVSVPALQSGTPRVQVARVGDLQAAKWLSVAPLLAWTDKPRWSPDGRRLYFVARNDGLFNVWTVEFDPSSGPRGAPEQVTHFSPPGLTISPDVDRVDFGVTANFLVVPLKRVAGSIWMLDNVDK